MALHQLDENDYHFWDEYVRNHPEGTIFHTSKWLQSHRGDLVVLVEKKANRILGGVAFIVKNRFGVKGIHNLPYTPFRGPLFGDINSKKHFKSHSKKADFIEQVTNKLKYGHVEFLLSTNDFNTLPYKWSGFTDQRLVTYQINDIANYSINNVTSNKRREIEGFLNLMENGEIELLINQELEMILELQKETGARSGFNPMTHILKDLLSSISGNYFSLGLKSKKYGLFSGGIFPFDNHTVYNLINGSKRIDHPVYKNANACLVYHAILMAKEKNKKFDFEGSSIKGVEQFYRMMGGVQHTRFRVLKSKNPFYFGLRAFQQWSQEIK
ncbi:hypothetical protein [Fulvivirga lutea]|uniref:Uncharacterized protein n=1 Tax=Fulvivirga lutea TaxID=2810512 RepID=A0A975A042_9BACT|nr:hypothetical protein [Fulvivirga lutea]QSE96805.1 hypothetical protein JR347_14560 [Fulvivirga lutea]